MSAKIDIYLLDKTNNLIEEINIIKPKTYEILNITLKNNLKNLPEFFTLFYPSADNREIEIHNDEEYQLLKDTLFIRQIEKQDLGKSIFDIAYNKLDESKRDILDEKYNCYICQENIKHENPLFCYICQKIFHYKCLEDWSKQRLKYNETLKCPYCNKELPLEQWKQKLYFEENRKKDAELINQLKRDNIIKNEIFENFKEYKIKTYKLLNNIIIKINKLNLNINNNIGNNNDIKEFMEDVSYDNIDLQIDNVSQIIFDQFKKLEENINNKNNVEIINNDIKDRNKDIINRKIIHNNEIKIEENEINLDNDNSNEFELLKNDKFEINDININIGKNRNAIELVYYTKLGGFANIFGSEFVNNNKDNIKLIFNKGKPISLVDKFFLKKGENRIKLLIEKELTDLSYMFYDCSALKNIHDLKYLNTSKVTNFSKLFYVCSSLADINSIRYWDVSKGKNFSYLFTGCTSLINLSPLETWNVENGVNFSYMFCRCLNLMNINPLKKWNVSKGKNFSNMFSGCFLLSELSPLANWDIKSGNNFSGMFSQCKSLTDLDDLENWKKNNRFKIKDVK